MQYLDRVMIFAMRKILLVFAFFAADAALGKAFSDDWGCSPESPCLVRVIDGDTIQIGAGRYRLCGIDVPELGTKVGNEAKEFLTKQVNTRLFNGGSESLMCLPVGHGTPCDGRSAKKSYDRFVAQCFIGGDDIAEMMVERGYAQDLPRYSGGYYRTEL